MIFCEKIFYNEYGDTMAFLMISSGNSYIDAVLLKEGEVWQIDKYTLGLEDSNEVRKKNAQKMKQFEAEHPFSGRGAVRLFQSIEGEEVKEWMVLYHKHAVVFPTLIKNPQFMAFMVKRSREFFAPYDYSVLTYRPKEVARHMGHYCHNLKIADEKETGEKKGRRYYKFLREVIFQYTQYCKYYSDSSIDDIYASLKAKQDAKKKGPQKVAKTLPKKVTYIPTPETRIVPTFEPIEWLDPDQSLYDEMDREEIEPSPLTLFLGAPDFERYYGDIFSQDFLFLFGNSKEERSEYEKWYAILEEAFPGHICIPQIGKGAKYAQNFDMAKIVIFLVEESEKAVEKAMVEALMNQAKVVIIAKRDSLVAYYQKKFPKAVVLKEDEEFTSKFADFMIDAYNEERGKKYPKK